MRYLIFIFSFLPFMGFSQIQLVGNITTFGGGSYPTHIDSLGYGGLTVVADATERDAITQLRRKVGMVVFQVDESQLYYLDAPITENNWVPIETGVTAIDTVQTTIYCPAHGLDLTDYEGEFLPMFACRGAQADHIDSLQTYYAVSIPDPDSITIIASGLIYRPNHDLADFIGKIVYLTNTVGAYDTIQGTVLSAIAVVIDSNYIDLLPRSVLESENGLFVLPLPAAFLNSYMGDSRVPQDTAVQRLARLYANVGLLRAGGKIITQSPAISDNPIYTSTGANPVNPGMSWTWTGGVNGRVIKDKELLVAIDLADTTYGGLNITPLDTVVLVGGVPTDTTVFNWLQTNLTDNNLRLPNGSLLYFVGAGSRQNPDYVWSVMDDISGNVGGATRWSRLIKRIKEPGGSSTSTLSYENRDTITQVAHGFISLPIKGYIPIAKFGGWWTEANSTVDSMFHSAFLVQIIDADRFVIQSGGLFKKTSHGLTTNQVYYLNDDGSERITADSTYIVPTAIALDADNINFLVGLRDVPAVSISGLAQSTASNGLFTSGGVPFGNTDLKLTEDPTQLFYNNSLDRFGIGTNAPLDKLHIKSGNSGVASVFSTGGFTVENSLSAYINILTPNNREGGIIFSDPQRSDAAFMAYAHSNNDFVFNSGATFTFNTAYPSSVLALKMLANGNVGVNIALPQYKLHTAITSSSANTIVYPFAIEHNASVTTSVGHGVGITLNAENSSNLQRAVAAIEGVFTNIASGTGASDMVFKVINTDNSYEAGRFKSTGDFQITGTLLRVGGTTSSFPALKRSTVNLIARLADDSANTDLEVLDETYGVGWNGSLEVPTKNAVYDKIETVGGLYLPLAGGTLTGHLLFTDNTYDIGASGLTRPRTGYFGTSVVSPVFNATTGFQVSGAAASGKILKANGTNFVASTETYAAPGSSGNVMTSDGTNWTSAAPASAVVNLSLTGTSQVIELTNSAGTDIVAKGVGIGLTKVTGTKDTLYFTRIEHWGEVSISGGSTAVTAATPERPDNDTPGTPTASLSSEFTQSGSTVTYIGAAGQAELTGAVSFTTDAIGDYLISLYQEGVELPVTEVRVSCLIGSYVTVPVLTTSVNVATNDTFDLRIEPVTGSATITVHKYNVYARKIY